MVNLRISRLIELLFKMPIRVHFASAFSFVKLYGLLLTLRRRTCQ